MCAQFLRNINNQKNITLKKYLFSLIYTYKYCFLDKLVHFAKYIIFVA